MRFFDPLPLAPFLAWAEQRQTAIVRELNAHPSIRSEKGDRGDRHGRLASSTGRLVAELGWPLPHPLIRRAPLCGLCIGEQREAAEQKTAAAA
ncbi:MAG: hypothetical protein WKF96_01220 [Solirubrobacteraceae bacterium]